jgi:hypothetical protein
MIIEIILTLVAAIIGLILVGIIIDTTISAFRRLTINEIEKIMNDK